jgi:large repetitive protein
VGVAYAQNFFVQGGVAPFTWSVQSGQLPPGLGLISTDAPNDNNNQLAGTPTTAGTFVFTVQVTDSQGAHTTRQDSLTIHPRLVDATPSHLPAGTVGVAYSQHLIAQGGLAPYSWFIVSGQLPAGLFLGATPPDFNNLLSGTPTTAGTFTFTMQVWDARGDQASGSVTVTINR